MPNHYHLIVQQQEGGSISRFVQTTFNTYVQAFNRQLNHSGTLFEGRVRAKRIESDQYVVRLAAYLHLNPVRARLVAHLEEWMYSDYHSWVGDESNFSEGGVLRLRYFRDPDGYRSLIEEMRARDSVKKIEAYLFEE